MYLPIWANANANARCMVSGTSGSFVGETTTHQNGYFDNKGYFDIGLNYSELGVAANNNQLGLLSITSPTNPFPALGGFRHAASRLEAFVYDGLLNGRSASGAYTSAEWVNHTQPNDFIGIITSTAFGSTLVLKQRKSAGVIKTNTVNRASVTPFSSALDIWLAGANGAGTSANCNSKIGAMFLNLGMSDVDTDAFTLALKTLWETVTGLILDDAGAEVISAVEATGVTVTTAQRDAIHAFFTAGNNEGWLSALKRFYLPIWANEEANTIDWITRTKGSFVGGVTHAAGYVQSDGTGWMDTRTTLAVNDITTSSAYACFLAKTNMVGGNALGSRNTITRHFGMSRSGNSISAQIMTNSATGGLHSTFVGTDGFVGILSGSRTNGTRFNAKRVTSGRTNLGSVTGNNFGTIPNPTIALMGLNIATTGISGIPTNQFGGFAIGSGLTDFEDAAFTLALKTLWETCTGLTLP
jgi:hypothetical protein